MSVTLGRRILPCLIGAGLVAACSDGSGPTAGSQGTLSFAQSSTAAPASLSAAPITIGGQTLTLSQVQVVFSEVELKQADHSGTCTAEGPGCEEFEAGPVLIDLPLGGGVITPLSSGVTAGTYSEAELKVDIPSEDDAATTAFLAAHPSWPSTASVHVVGTFDAGDGAGAQPFDVYLAGEAELELGFNPPLVVDGSGAFNVTVAIDPNAWFVSSGGGLIDPRALSTDQSLQESVFTNIDTSFHAFEDDNHDGVED
jgi:hypothetical protein